MAKRRKGRGSSKAGRPRKEGDRYPSGKLKPPVPNAVLLAKRAIGDVEAGEHPLDFALERKWITEDQHRAAMSYVGAYRSAHIGGPRLSSGSLQEAKPSEALRTNWSEMSDEDVATIWDQVFCTDLAPADADKVEATALAKWGLLNRALTSEEREELFRVCVMGSWPFWMPKVAAGKTLGVQDERRRATLMGGLGNVSRAHRKPKGKPTTTPVEYHPSTKGKAELPVRYETEDGQEVKPTSDLGVPFEVTILRKRA